MTSNDKLRGKILNKIETQLVLIDSMNEELIPDIEARGKFFKDCKKLFETSELSEIQNAYHISDNCRHGKTYFSFCESIILDIEEFKDV